MSWATSRRAVMGLTRLALRAGATAEITVTVTPTMAEVTMVAVEMTTGPDGISRPTAPSSSRSPKDISTPRPRPTAEATRPTPMDSTRTERSTCRRLAPMARSIAISRERWATMIEKVL